jgi:hypothetical protein
MRICVLAGVLLLAVTSAVRAETGVLISHVPPGADRSVVMAVVRHALERRGWRVTHVDSHSISATINGNKTDASIRLKVEEASIAYQGDAVLTVTSNGHSTKKPSALPKRWLEALRLDIGDALVAMPEQPQS